MPTCVKLKPRRLETCLFELFGRSKLLSDQIEVLFSWAETKSKLAIWILSVLDTITVTESFDLRRLLLFTRHPDIVEPETTAEGGDTVFDRG